MIGAETSSCASGVRHDRQRADAIGPVRPLPAGRAQSTSNYLYDEDEEWSDVPDIRMLAGALSSCAREHGDDRADVPDGDRAASARTSRASSSRLSCLRTARRRRARARPRGGRRRRGTPARGRRRGAQQQYTWRAECVRARSQGAASDDWRVAAAAAPTRAAHAASAHRARSS